MERRNKTPGDIAGTGSSGLGNGIIQCAENLGFLGRRYFAQTYNTQLPITQKPVPLMSLKFPPSFSNPSKTKYVITGDKDEPHTNHTNRQRNYLKILAIYKCSGDKCGKIWKSAHGWEREEEINCKFCDYEAKILNVVDEMMNLDNFRCVCGITWQSIHDDSGQPQECGCGKMVTSEGIQFRFGRHYTFICTNDLCKGEWEDFSITQKRTQRCSRCKSRGDIIGIKPLPPRILQTGLPLMEKGAHPHREDCCDMCQDIILQGKGRNCMAYRKVICKLEGNVGGVLSETIITVK